MTKTDRAKWIARNVVTLSVGWTVTEAIKNNTHPEKFHQKVEAAVGGYVLGSLVAEHAGVWTDRQIDSITDRWNKIQAKKPTLP